jgi:phosphoglycolate phosphatase-like HAD superfamily hydrolase
MSGLSEVRACLFDVNGVLIASNLANAMAMAEAFTDNRRLRERIVQLYLQLTGIDRGSKIRMIQEQVIGVAFEEGEFTLRWERFKQLGSFAMSKAPLMEGCLEVLDELGARGITRIALSNTPLIELRQTLAVLGVAPFLDRIRGGGDWPKSESLRRLLLELAWAPDECLFFGDGKGDLAAARENRVPFVAIDPGTGEFRGEQGFAGPYRHLKAWGLEALDEYRISNKEPQKVEGG